MNLLHFVYWFRDSVKSTLTLGFGQCEKYLMDFYVYPPRALLLAYIYILKATLLHQVE